MAHNIEIRNGVASFAESTKKETAWHKLGQHFDSEMDVKTALEASHANYIVEKVPCGWMDKNGVWNDDPTRKYISRTDTGDILGHVNASYGVVQNEEAFDFVNQLVAGGDKNTPFIESCGVLGMGERIFITCKFPEKFKCGDTTSDEGEMYCVITTSHDGSGSVACMMTPVRVVCNNTLSYALLNNKSMVRFRHTSGVSNRLRENVLHSAQVLGVYEATKTIIEAKTERLKRIEVTNKLLTKVCADIAFDKNADIFFSEGIESNKLSSQGKNTFNGLLASIESGIGQDMFRNHNGLWLYNGLTTYYQNYASFNSNGKENSERKFDNLFGGTTHKKLENAYNTIVNA